MTKTKIPGITLGGDVNGTCLQGYMTASYKDLVKLLGQPNGGTDGYKVSTEWVVTFQGKVYTIYDYKDTNLYDRDLPSVQKFRSMPSYEWHIGGGDFGRGSGKVDVGALTRTILDAIEKLPPSPPKVPKPSKRKGAEVPAEAFAEALASTFNVPIAEALGHATSLLSQYKLVRR